MSVSFSDYCVLRACCIDIIILGNGLGASSQPSWLMNSLIHCESKGICVFFCLSRICVSPVCTTCLLASRDEIVTVDDLNSTRATLQRMLKDYSAKVQGKPPTFNGYYYSTIRLE